MKEREQWRELFGVGELGGWVPALLRLESLKKEHILGVIETDFWTCEDWHVYQTSRWTYIVNPPSL